MQPSFCSSNSQGQIALETDGDQPREVRKTAREEVGGGTEKGEMKGKGWDKVEREEGQRAGKEGHEGEGVRGCLDDIQ
jgi:hypothetical protein